LRKTGCRWWFLLVNLWRMLVEDGGKATLISIAKKHATFLDLFLGCPVLGTDQ
jgi:hypothetical protein